MCVAAFFLRRGTEASVDVVVEALEAWSDGIETVAVGAVAGDVVGAVVGAVVVVVAGAVVVVLQRGTRGLAGRGGGARGRGRGLAR